MNLQDLLDFLNFIINKEQSGRFISPREFTLLLREANYKFFKKYFDVPEEYQIGNPMSRIEWELTDVVKEKLSRFMTELSFKNNNPLAVSNGIAQKPADMFFEDYFASSSGLGRILKGYEFEKISRNPVTGPTEDYPIATIKSNTIQVAPETITAISFHYLRRPEEPNFDYYVDENDNIIYLEPGETSPTTGNPANHPSESVELDWDVDCIWDIAYIILENMGIGINREQVIQYAQTKQIKGT